MKKNTVQAQDTVWGRLKALLLSFYSDIVSQKAYYLPILLFTLLAYGFSAFHRTLSVDDLSRAYYIGQGNTMLRAMRWGMPFWNRLFTATVYTPFVDKFFGIVFLLIAVALFSCLFYHLNGKNKWVWQYTIFSCAFLTYPLIHEIWEYSGANMVVAGNFVLIAIAALYQLLTDKLSFRSVLIAGLFLTPVMASYESGVFAYISLVFIILYLERWVYEKKYAKRSWLQEGLSYALPLFIAVALRFIVGFFLLFVFRLDYQPNGATDILWFTDPNVMGFLHTMVWRYGINALVYFPITVFILCMLVFVILSVWRSIQTKNAALIWLGFFLVLSLFFQAYIQLVTLPYRTAQPIQLFSMFVIYLVLWETHRCAQGGKRKYTERIAVVLTLFLCMRQAVYLNQMLALNNQRSDNEAAIVHQIGYRLKAEYAQKPVVFVGAYALGDWIDAQIMPDGSTIGGKLYGYIAGKFGYSMDEAYVSTNVNSYLTWVTGAFKNNAPLYQSFVGYYFSYYGYDIEITDDAPALWTQATAYAKGMQTFEIADRGGYIIVKLGDVVE